MTHPTILQECQLGAGIIEAAELIIQTEFKHSYEKSSCTEGGEDGDEKVDALVCLCFHAVVAKVHFLSVRVQHQVIYLTISQHYLSQGLLNSDPEHVENVLLWWHKQCLVYPCLSCMAQDYLTIPRV